MGTGPVTVPGGEPSPGVLWHQAGGDPGRYRDLLREHGHLLAPGDPGYDAGARTLPCGWGPGEKTRDPEERCKHDMLRSQCADCTGRTGDQRPAPDTAGYGPWFTAGRHSRCAGPCGERIKPGDRIRADGEHGYLCETCGQDSNSP